MWRQWLVTALRTVTALMLGGVYLTGYFVLQAGIEVVGLIVGASVLTAALICIVLGRARYFYVVLLFICAGPSLYSLTLVGVPLDAVAVTVVAIVGATTIAYGAAELRSQGGEPFRDPIEMLYVDEDDLYLDDPICVPTATVMTSRAAIR